MINVRVPIVGYVHLSVQQMFFRIKENKICVNSPQYCKLCYECLELCPSMALELNKKEENFL